MFWNKYFFQYDESFDFKKFQRVFYFAHLLAAYMIGVPWRIIDRYSELLYSPNILFGIFDVRKQSEFFFDVMGAIFILSLTLSAFGVFSKFSRSVAAIASIYYYGMKYNYSDLVRVDGHLTVSLFVVAAASFGELKANQVWPVKLIRLYFVLIFFSAGLLKLRINMGDWIFENAVGRALLMSEPSFVYKFKNWPGLFPLFQDMRQLILENEFVGRFISISTLFVELASPLALWKKTKNIAVGSLMLFLIGVFCLMSHLFIFSMLPLAVAFASFRKRGALSLI